jgi:hypothetical protein
MGGGKRICLRIARRKHKMTVDEFLEVSSVIGWEEISRGKRYYRFPFCKMEIIELIEVSPPRSVCMNRRRQWLMKACPNTNYPKGYLTRMRKCNEKVFAMLPDGIGSGFVAAMRYSV